jgi:hypothetical protein
MFVPTPVRLFHITAIANLPAILATGALVSKKAGASAGIAYQNIAHSGAQGARATKQVPNPPGGSVHDFVPFYFAPRSPMLMAINSGKVMGCNLRQEDIVHFETTVDKVTQDETPFVFYDRNATLAFATPHTDLQKLNVVAWDLLTEMPRLDGFCKYWKNTLDVERYVDRMEKRQAEFLVRDRVAINCITRLGTINEAKANEVRAVLALHGVDLPVQVMCDWYFLPGQ